MNNGIKLGPGREFDLIRSMLRVWGDIAVGIGSDAAVLEVPAGLRLVTSTDSSIENIHFRRAWLTASQIGYRATVAALSDLAAAGAQPGGILVALALPSSWKDDAEQIAAGIGEAVRDCGTLILGGDTSSANELSLTITVFGFAAKPLTRSGAHVGDRIVLTGDVGRSAAALASLQNDVQPSALTMERFARPQPRIKEGSWLARAGATAAIDVSDGLISELSHLAAASNVRMSVDLAKIPIAPGSGIDVQAALISGEEYELLATIPHSLDLTAFGQAFQTRITEIGSVVEGEAGVDIKHHGTPFALPQRGGHDHF